MAFFPPIPLIRKNVILKNLRDCGATSAKTARTLAEAGVNNPNPYRGTGRVVGNCWLLDKGKVRFPDRVYDDKVPDCRRGAGA